MTIHPEKCSRSAFSHRLLIFLCYTPKCEKNPPERLDLRLPFGCSPGADLPQACAVSAQLDRAGAADLRHSEMPRARRDHGARRWRTFSCARDGVAGVSAGLRQRRHLVSRQLLLGLLRHARVRRDWDDDLRRAASDVRAVSRACITDCLGFCWRLSLRGAMVSACGR